MLPVVRKLSLMTRLILFRVTACLACRFDTASPRRALSKGFGLARTVKNRSLDLIGLSNTCLNSIALSNLARLAKRASDTLMTP